MIKSRGSKKHIAVYVRVSTDQQNTAGQERDLRRWIAANKMKPTVWYRDRSSGLKMTRPAFDEMLENIRGGLVDTVVIWRLDRLGRTARGLVNLLDDWSQAKIRVMSMMEGLDLSTPGGRLMCNVLASVASFETEIRAERIRSGQAAAWAKGKRWGGSVKGRLIKVTKKNIETIRRMLNDKWAIRTICRAVGLSAPTVYRLMADYHMR